MLCVKVCIIVYKVMTITKNDFIRIADIIGRTKDRQEITKELITYFKEVNALFDEYTFLNYIQKIENENRGIN